MDESVSEGLQTVPTVEISPPVLPPPPEVGGVLSKLESRFNEDVKAPDVDVETGTFDGLKQELEIELTKRIQQTAISDPEKTVAELAVAQRTERLRHPRFQSVMKLLSSGMSPDLTRRVSGTLAEFRRFLPDKKQFTRYRVHAPLLAALWRDREARVYLESAIRETVTEGSDLIKEKIESGGYYSPVTIIGSGPVGTAVANVIGGIRPDITPLFIEAEASIGGEFAKSEGDAFFLNSPNKAQDNPNSLGMLSPLETSHVTGAYYPSSAEMGGVTMVDAALSGEALVNAQVLQINRAADDSIGRYEIIFVDRRNQKRYSIATNKVVLTTGFGETNHGFALVGESRSIVEESVQIFESGGVPQYMTLDQFNTLRGKKTKEAQRAFGGRDILIIGGGHGGATVVENLTGKGGSASDRLISDQPDHIDWAGFKYETAQDMISGMGMLGRYSQSAAELPKKPGEESRLKGIDGHVMGLKRDKADPTKIIATFKLRDGTTFEKSYDGVVNTAGFIDRSRGVIGNLFTREITDPQAIKQEARTALLRPMTVIYYEDKSGTQLMPLPVSTRVDSVKTKDNQNYSIELTVTNKDGTVTREKHTLNTADEASTEGFYALFGETSIISRIGLTDEEDLHFDGVKSDIPLGRRISGEDIYILGNASGLPGTKAENEWVENQPYNSSLVAMAVQVPKASLAAVHIADSIPSKEGRSEDKEGIRTTREPIRLSSMDGDDRMAVFEMSTPHMGIPNEATMDNLLKVALANVSERFIFPPGCPDMTFTVRSTGGKDGKMHLAIDCNPPLPNNQEYLGLMGAMFEQNPLMKGLCCTLLTGAYKDGFSISLPMSGEKPRIEAVNIAPMRGQREGSTASRQEERAIDGEKRELGDIGADELTTLLKQTGKAHHAFELDQKMNRGNPNWTDADWQGWYADYFLKLARAGNIDTSLTQDQMRALLDTADKEYTTLSKEEKEKIAWPNFYANYVIDNANALRT